MSCHKLPDGKVERDGRIQTVRDLIMKDDQQLAYIIIFGSKQVPLGVSCTVSVQFNLVCAAIIEEVSEAEQALTNGTSHSPTALNGAPSPPNGFSNGPSSSSSSSLANQQLPPACGARQLSKLKRFLTTLQQFGNDISPEIGERVRTLVLGLVNSTLTIEEFHSKLQEATNFPLRPFVIPFLKANLPLLQRELLHCARLAKQNPAQYLAQHEQLLLDASTTSPVDSSELLLDVNENGKRRTPDRTKENGFDREPLHSEHPSKRPCTISPGQRYSPNNGLSYQPNGLPHPTPPPPQHYRLDDMAIAHHYRDSYRHPNHRDLRDRNRPMESHREFLHRPASGYVPEEIWKKAGLMVLWSRVGFGVLRAQQHQELVFTVQSAEEINKSKD
ncbi:UNVERIFIED_CONTAM: hypothetical protein H355_016627 [Colinus virginianus]|nr:hypothetical protein H355_016627 [Colinus virginianus]